MITETDKLILEEIELKIYNASIHARGLGLVMRDRSEMSIENFCDITSNRDKAIRYKDESETVFELMVLNLSLLEKQLRTVSDIVGDIR